MGSGHRGTQKENPAKPPAKLLAGGVDAGIRDDAIRLLPVAVTGSAGGDTRRSRLGTAPPLERSHLLGAGEDLALVVSGAGPWGLHRDGDGAASRRAGGARRGLSIGHVLRLFVLAAAAAASLLVHAAVVAAVGALRLDACLCRRCLDGCLCCLCLHTHGRRGGGRRSRRGRHGRLPRRGRRGGGGRAAAPAGCRPDLLRQRCRWDRLLHHHQARPLRLRLRPRLHHSHAAVGEPQAQGSVVQAGTQAGGVDVARQLQGAAVDGRALCR